MSEDKISATEAMRQAGMRVDDYLAKAHGILKSYYEDWSIEHATALASIMSTDFHTTMLCMKLQEIRDAIHQLTEVMNDK